VFRVSERVVNREEGTAFVRLAEGSGYWVAEHLEGLVLALTV